VTIDAETERAAVAEAWARLARAITQSDEILREPDVPERLGENRDRPKDDTQIREIAPLPRFAKRPFEIGASFGEAPRDYLLAEGFIPADLDEAYRSVAAQALDGVRRCYERAGAVRALRLHGDCHAGNVLWTDSGPHFVDFDDSRMGPAVQDLWMLLSGERAEMTRQLGDVLAGYEDFHDFDRHELHLIEALRTLPLPDGMVLIPGVIGGVAGAYLLTAIDGDIIKPYIAAYLLLMGGVIIYKAFTIKPRNKPDEYHGPRISWLGLLGGFCDAIGGGGWGPVVTSTLVARGKYARTTIGSVNFSEFFVTFAESVVFILTLSLSDYWQIILGLLIGGGIAAPLAARMTKNLPLKALMIMVGALIIILSIRTIYLALR